MLFVNVPIAFAWFILYNAKSVFAIFTAAVMFGYFIALVDSPIVAYVGEIW